MSSIKIQFVQSEFQLAVLPRMKSQQHVTVYPLDKTECNLTNG